MKILILDDDVQRHEMFSNKLKYDEVKHTYTAKEAIDALQNNTFDYCFLDHDLGGKVFFPSDPDTGMEVAVWLAANPKKQPRVIIIHSFNPVGATNMIGVLPGALVLPGAWNNIKGD
jgi:CheY-like chemotaxis protein